MSWLIVSIVYFQQLRYNLTSSQDEFIELLKEEIDGKEKVC